jgi:hypothetical protein
MYDESRPTSRANASRTDGYFGDRTSPPTRTRKELAVRAIEYLVLGTEQFLRELPDDEFAALVARCRPPGDPHPTSNTSSTKAGSP